MSSILVQTWLTFLRSAAAVTAFLVLFISCSGGGSDAVTAPVTTISLTDSDVTVEVAFSHHLTVVATPAGAIPPVTWSSSNPSVAIVSGGYVTGVAPGTATITAKANTQMATAAVTVIPTVVVSIQLSRSAVTMAPGGTLQLRANPLDASERVVAGRTTTFTSSDTVIAVVRSDGFVAAKDVGKAIVTATVDGKTSSLAVDVVFPTPISAVVRAAIPLGLLKLNGYSLTLRNDDDSLTLRSTKLSSWPLSGSMLLADTVQYIARGDTTGSDASWPSAMIANRADLPASVSVVFIPKKVSLTSGAFAGSVIWTNMSDALDRCGSPGGQCVNGFYPETFRTGVEAWPSFPVPVAVTGFDPADSATIWSALNAMESAVGRQLFVPVSVHDPANRITVQIGNTLGFAGYARWQFNTSDQITGASVSFRSAGVLSRRLVQHEILHALGFWHTCSWPSVMGGYGCVGAPEMSPDDVGYFVLAQAIHDAETPLRMASGLLPCGAMSIGATTRVTQKVSCVGDNWKTPMEDARLRQARTIGIVTAQRDSAP